MLYLWLDDERKMPPGFHLHCRTAFDCMEALERHKPIAFISFDHDLGSPENGTGYDVAKWLERAAYNGRCYVREWAVHSANPVGRKRIIIALQNMDRYLKENNLC